MIRPLLLSLALAATAAAPVLAEPAPPPPADSGVIRVSARHDVDQTVAQIEADVAAKGVNFFSKIDQSELGTAAKIAVRRSVLVQFGNPPLGLQFLTDTPYAGLDWPVRMLVFQDGDGQTWIAYSDFAYIGRRHHMADRDAQLKMASEVAASIAAAGAR